VSLFFGRGVPAGDRQELPLSFGRKVAGTKESPLSVGDGAKGLEENQ
jgi:hypothetical protein